MEWSGTAWAFFPHYILDGFVLFCKWAPQYTTDQFGVFFRLKMCIYLDSNLWPPVLIDTTLPINPLLHMKITSPPSSQTSHTVHTGYQLPAISCNQRTFSALYCGSIRAIENVTQFVQPFQPTTNRLWLVLPLFPHYTAGVVEHSRLMNQNSLPSNTEKWCLCNNPNTSVSINKQCFP